MLQAHPESPPGSLRSLPPRPTPDVRAVECGRWFAGLPAPLRRDRRWRAVTAWRRDDAVRIGLRLAPRSGRQVVRRGPEEAFDR